MHFYKGLGQDNNCNFFELSEARWRSLAPDIFILTQSFKEISSLEQYLLPTEL